MERLRVGLLFGGRSVEHEVSVASATSILGALDGSRYDVSLIAIDDDGRWHMGPPELPSHTVERGQESSLPAAPGGATLIPAGGSGGVEAKLDVILPIVHGRGGEDGALQGLLELAEVPYVGSRVLGSAVQMDKDVAKRLLAAAGLPVVPWVCAQGPELRPERLPGLASRIEGELGLPVFVKPANSGSSVGISRAADHDALVAALAEARRYDRKVLAECGLAAREIEVAVLGNDEPLASVPGEIRTAHTFYDYEAKYRDDATELLIPAPIPEALAGQLRSLAIECFRVLEGRGLARVDFLLVDGDGGAEPRVYVNELNSLPGFTRGSMFPRLWEATGLPYAELLDRMIALALEEHREQAQLVTRPPDATRLVE